MSDELIGSEIVAERTRPLATIQSVNAIEPIEGADAIEKIRVQGWWVVVKKGEFKLNDKLTYIEIDSLLPVRPEFEFLRKSCYKKALPDGSLPEGFRIKTIRLRGQVSQGICFPLSILPEGVSTEEGSDVTDALKIVKYEKPISASLRGKVKGNFPSFIHKTDETRIQSQEELLTEYRNVVFYVTEKLDGSSFTAFVKDDQFGVCSRNLQIDTTCNESIFAKVANMYDLEPKMKALKEVLGYDFAIQGELIGPGIQKNKYQLAQYELYLFNLFNISSGNREPLANLIKVSNALSVKTVPVVDTVELNHTVDQLVTMSEGFSKLNSGVQREGLVFRPLEQPQNKYGASISFKVINPNFLLKYDE